VVSPFVSQRLGTLVASENAADLITINQLIEAGHLTPAIDRTYPLRETAEAIIHLLSGGSPQEDRHHPSEPAPRQQQLTRGHQQSTRGTVRSGAAGEAVTCLVF
jgi:hypothetical protein